MAAPRLWPSTTTRAPAAGAAASVARTAAASCPRMLAYVSTEKPLLTRQPAHVALAASDCAAGTIEMSKSSSHSSTPMVPRKATTTSVVDAEKPTTPVTLDVALNRYVTRVSGTVGAAHGLHVHVSMARALQYETPTQRTYWSASASSYGTVATTEHADSAATASAHAPICRTGSIADAHTKAQDKPCGQVRASCEDMRAQCCAHVVARLSAAAKPRLEPCAPPPAPPPPPRHARLARGARARTCRVTCPAPHAHAYPAHISARVACACGIVSLHAWLARAG